MKILTTQKRYKDRHALRGISRALLLTLIVAVQMIYFPTSEQLSGGIEPRLPIDVFPILPVWVLPYVLCYPLWIFALVWATFKMDDSMFRAFIAAALLTCTFSITLFVFFPTYVPAATLHGDDLFTNLLRTIHEDWGRYNALPSGHIYITVLLALFYSQWYPRFKNMCIAITVIVSLSTLFTGQHYLADVIAGLLVAFIGYHLGWLWAGRSGIELSQAHPGTQRSNDFIR